jgi:formate dehydrogenase
MIRGIEGKQGETRMRPPYIAETGLFDRPTLGLALKPCTGC